MSEYRRGWALRTLIMALLLLLAALQVRLWVSADGLRGVRALQARIAMQRQENQRLAERNQRLEADVRDLKKGFGALEERARADLGLILPGETFYLLGDSQDRDESADP